MTEHQSLAAYRTAEEQDEIDDTFVEKETGKGLSSNDFTTAEKTKLSGIADGATNVTESTVTGWGFAKQYATMPTAALSLVGKIAQFVGTTTANYINGYFYKCVDNSTAESITAVEDDDIGTLGDITIDTAVLKSALSAGTYSFEKKGYPKTVVIMNYGNMSVITMERNPGEEDGFNGSSYCWLGGDNNFYWSRNEIIKPNDTLYSTADLSTDSGFIAVSVTETDSARSYWSLDGDFVNLDNYGILMQTYGFTGNKIRVDYVAANESYAWENIAVQDVPTIEYVIVSGSSGTMTAAQMAVLDGSYNNYIMCDNERYDFSDEQNTDKYVVYSHTGRNASGQTYIKTIYLYDDETALTYGAWTKSVNEVISNPSDGGNLMKIL